MLAHLSVRDRDARLGHEFGQVRGDALDRLHPVVHVEHLSLAQQLAPDRGGDLLVAARADVREDRMPVFGRRLQGRHLTDAGDRHFQGAGNGGRAHREDVDVGLELLQGILVLDAEPLLLVDDHEAEVFEDDLLGEDAVRADDHVDGAVGEPRERVAGFFVGLEARERAHLHGEPGEALGEGLEVLLDEQRRRHEHGDLLAVLNRLERGAHGDLGLAEADVSRQQAVHRDGPLHVGFDLVDRLQLVGRLGEREGLFELALPRRVGPERVAFRRHARRVELDELDGDVAHGLSRLALRRRPVAAAHLRQGRRVAADVFAQQVELIGGDEQLVARVPALGRRVFEHEVLAGGLHRVPSTRRHLALHELDEAPDAVRGVHDDVARLQLQRVDDVPPPRGELLHHTPVGADRAAVELGLGEHGELRLGQLEAALELAQHGDDDTRLGSVVEPLGGARRDAAVGEHVPGAVDETGARGGDRDAPPVGDERTDVGRGAVDVPLERRHRARGHAHDVARAEAFVGGIRLARIEAAERPPHPTALTRRGVQFGQGEKVARVEVDGRVGARRRGTPRGFEELAVGLAEGHRTRDGPLGIDEGDGRATGQVIDERHDAVGDGGQERLHALHRDAFAHLLEHRAEPRELAVQCGSAVTHPGREQQFARGEQRDGGHLARQ